MLTSYISLAVNAVWIVAGDICRLSKLSVTDGARFFGK